MSEARATQRLNAFSNACHGCGSCLSSCELLSGLGMTPVQIAQNVLSGQELKEGLDQAIVRCALCGLCSHSCPVDLNPADLMQTAREILLAHGITDLDDYQMMLVDNTWHFFNLYRNSWGINYYDLAVDSCEDLFFPGCTLASYAPELTRAAYGWLRDQGLKVGIVPDCCGLPLSSLGLMERASQMLERLRAKMELVGAKRLITACPNCFYHFQKHLPHVEVAPLYQLMAEAGVQVSGMSKITVHDSCPDRDSGLIGEQMRRLLGGYSLTEMVHHGQSTMCCGSGGIVSMVDPGLSNQRAKLRIAEFDASTADYCVTACMGCTKRLESACLPDNRDPRQPSQSARVRHLLELIFDLPIDHEQIQANINHMWQGEKGEHNWRLLASAQRSAQNGEPHA